MVGIAKSLSSFAQSWGIQRRVVGALLMREVLTRFGRHNIGFLWLFVEPMLFTLGVTALWTAAGLNHGSTLPIVGFALTGYSSVLLWRNMPSRCIGSIEPNLSLLYHRNVKVMDVMLARLLLEGGGATISFTILSILFISIGWLEPPEDLLKVIGGWIMLAWFGMSLALFLASLAEKNEIVDKLWHPASYLLFPLSGAAFLVDSLPQTVQEYALWLPMVNGVEYLREGYFGTLIVAHHDMPYMIVFNALMSVAALSLLRNVAREVVPG